MRQAVRNLLGGGPNEDGPFVERVRLDWTAGEPEVSPVNDRWTRVVLTPFDLELRTVDSGSGDQLFLVTPGGYAIYLHLVQSEAVDPGSGEPRWRIIRTEDRPPTGAAPRAVTLETTWGRILALFH
ncbi:MAG: hypothetical protein GF346_00955 [Candidatus Eisenbacteria bacterium]|nr:hypothetical protein [Candidatus Latescibacterota bacterium]MBD3301001.1 hypothetical protein [Candidatus Eisenbacteria bacterium]